MKLTEAQRLKFEVLASGIKITERCETYLAEANRSRPLTPADYASTTGLILALEDDVWVNAPVAAHNPNFVTDPGFTLDIDDHGCTLKGEGLSSGADVWLPPAYHGDLAPWGRPWNDFVFTHGDRARLAPIGGCAMACKFCNLPYEDPYVTKPIDQLVEAVRMAVADPVQPARHLLISGGTPRPDDIGYLRDVYRQLLEAFPDLEVDIMMAPVDGLLDLAELHGLGLHQLSINIEVFDVETARILMPHKYRQGLHHYLSYIERAAGIFGPGRVRSMLMVGLEDEDRTLTGVRAILDAGGVPVLSPFRPDPATPLRGRTPPDAATLARVHCAAHELAAAAGSTLGPDCGPCTHNTLTFVEPSASTGRRWPLRMASAP